RRQESLLPSSHDQTHRRYLLHLFNSFPLDQKISLSSSKSQTTYGNNNRQIRERRRRRTSSSVQHGLCSPDPVASDRPLPSYSSWNLINGELSRLLQVGGSHRSGSSTVN
ncbi:unnamed protein product, partial [Linum tenue]